MDAGRREGAAEPDCPNHAAGQQEVEASVSPSPEPEMFFFPTPAVPSLFSPESSRLVVAVAVTRAEQEKDGSLLGQRNVSPPVY